MAAVKIAVIRTNTLGCRVFRDQTEIEGSARETKVVVTLGRVLKEARQSLPRAVALLHVLQLRTHA